MYGEAFEVFDASRISPRQQILFTPPISLSHGPNLAQPSIVIKAAVGLDKLLIQLVESQLDSGPDISEANLSTP